MLLKRTKIKENGFENIRALTIPDTAYATQHFVESFMTNHSFARAMHKQATEAITKELSFEILQNSFSLKSHHIDEIVCECDVAALRNVSLTNCKNNTSVQNENQDH